MNRPEEAEPAKNLLDADANDYFKSSDETPWPGSSQSIASSSTTGPSTSSSFGSYRRTPLSSKAKPFQSRHIIAGYGSPSEGAWSNLWPELPYSEELQEQAVLGGCVSQNGGPPGQVHLATFGNWRPALGGTSEASTSPGHSALLPARIPSRTPSPVQRGEIHQLCPTRNEDVLGHENTGRAIGIESHGIESHAIIATAERPWNSIEQMQMPSSSSSSHRSSMIIKHTFLHQSTDDDEETQQQGNLRRCSSSPGALGSSTIPEHDSSGCKPCAYFFGKEDGCRMGADCAFCHLCPPGMIRQKKKQKMKQLRAAAVNNWVEY